MSQDQNTPQLHPDRNQLFINEAFAIGMSQAISGGSIVASLSQFDAITANAGRHTFLLFISFMALSLIASVLAAYWRHQYKLWDVKRVVPKAGKYLAAMRYAMVASVVLTISAILLLIGGFWIAM